MVNISIIIPVYNVEQYLEECLESVVNQTFHDYEIILVNDGSTDGSLAICESYRKKYDNIKLISQKNKGLSAARNAGIASAEGEYIAFLDSDDYLDLDFCDVMYGIIKEHNLDLVICGHMAFDDTTSEKIFHKDPKSDVSLLNRVLNNSEALRAYVLLRTSDSCVFSLNSATAKLYRKSLFDETGIRFPEGSLHEDIVPALEIFKAVSSCFFIDRNLLYYRKRLSGITGWCSFSEKNIKDLFIQCCILIGNFNNIDSLIVSNEIKACNIRYYTKFLSAYYLDYQIYAYISMVITDAVPNDTYILLFGASKMGCDYVSILKSRHKRIIFVDNDPNKHGNTLMGYPIISAYELKPFMAEHDCRLFITTVYFFDILIQLLDLGIIKDITEVFVYGGSELKYLIEETYKTSFERLIELYKNSAHILLKENMTVI